MSRSWRRRSEDTPTYVVGFVKDDNGVLGHLLRDLFGDLGIQQIMERIDDDVYKRHLRVRECR